MGDDALKFALFAALFAEPLSAYLEKRPSTPIFYRMLLVGGVTYIGLKTAGTLLRPKD